MEWKRGQRKNLKVRKVSCCSFGFAVTSVSHVAQQIPVEEDMKALLDSYNEKESHNLKDLAKFHAKFEKIHPFQDGNGRTGRMILFKECLRSNVMPFIIGDDRKADYYECLNNAQRNEVYEPLIQFFEQEQERYTEMVKDFICPVMKTRGSICFTS